MNDEKASTIIEKIEEMRDFLRIGDEVIPFLGELFRFIQQVMPLMSEVNSSFKDSTSKLPDAEDRISDVTKATELATTEIMDTLDEISENVELLAEGQSEEKQKIAETINNHIQDVLMSLQFQDITSQKLTHANQILVAISKKFSGLHLKTEHIKLNTKIGEKMINELQIGINSEKIKKDSEDFHKETEDVIRHEKISQDDIDDLFG